MFQFAEFLHHAALTLLILQQLRCIYPSAFSENMPARLALGFGHCLHLGLITQKGKGSRPGWGHGLVTDLSHGNLLAARCQKQRGGRGVFYWHLHLARLKVFSA